MVMSSGIWSCYFPELWIRSICLALETQSRTLSSHRSASALRPCWRALSARFPHTRTLAIAAVYLSLISSISGFRRAIGLSNADCFLGGASWLDHAPAQRSASTTTCAFFSLGSCVRLCATERNGLAFRALRLAMPRQTLRGGGAMVESQIRTAPRPHLAPSVPSTKGIFFTHTARSAVV